MKKRALLIFLSFATISGAVSCAPPSDKESGPGNLLPESLSWGVRATQGATYVMDLALLKIWEEQLGIKCFATQVASSVAAFPRLKSGRLDIWKSGIRDAYLANRGLDEYGAPISTFDCCSRRKMSTWLLRCYPTPASSGWRISPEEPSLIRRSAPSP